MDTYWVCQFINFIFFQFAEADRLSLAAVTAQAMAANGKLRGRLRETRHHVQDRSRKPP